MPFVDRQYAAARAAFLAAAREYGMFDRARGVLVGYSGGADSTLLLRLMRDYCAEHGIYIAAVHVNHRIRGGEAERDAEHCGRTCDTLGVDFRLVTADIPAMARESGRGLEEEARNFRYETFERLLSEDDRLNIAATAHNADDNAETLLFNIARGAGVDGLSGIPPVRAMGQYRVVRPLIYLSKKDIIAACGSIGAEYVTDSTNADTAYTRNYIRHTLVPAFGKLNPSFTDAVQRLTSAARKDAEYLTSLAEGLTRECEVSADRVTIQAGKLAGAPSPVASRAVMRMFSLVSETALSAKQIDAVMRLPQSGDEISVSLPERMSAGIVKRGGTRYLVIGRATGDDADAKIPEISLKPGLNELIPGKSVIYMYAESTEIGEIEKYTGKLKNIYKSSIRTELNSDKIKHILFVRSRADGDSWVYGGMTRKLKKLCNDRGLGKTERDSLPVVCDDDGILWVPGFGTADRAACPKTGENASGKITLCYYFN